MSFWVFTQNKTYYDSLTYYQFISNQHKKVIKTGKKALKNDIDFYYLRYRMAYSNFELKKYIQCIPHFKALLEMNPSDEIAMEYLYYCYLETGQTINAYKLSKEFSSLLKQKLSISDKKLDYVSMNYGHLNNKNISENEDKNYITKPKSASESSLQAKLEIVDLSLRSHLGKKGLLDFQSSYFLSSSKLIGQVDAARYVFDEKNNNLQFNLVYSHLGKRNWKMSTGLAYFYNSVSDLVNHKPITNSSGQVIKAPYFTDTLFKYNAYLFSLRTEKVGKTIQPIFALSYAQLFSVPHIQLSLGLSYYPFGGMRFYGKTMLYILSKGRGTVEPIMHQILGIQLYKNIWLESVFMSGEMQNVNLDNGILTFNTADPIKTNVGFDLLFRLKKLSIIPSYRYQIRAFDVNVINNNKTTFKTTSYSNNILNLTLKWHF
ncbi:MAG: hypothetical protein HYU67_09620 [Flavobacteriia bacterium]|nr:hypothetical protein [Flavobacteriia bacterium]